MSQEELQRAIQELIEFVMTRDRGGRYEHGPHDETTTLYSTNRKDADSKTDISNNDRDIYAPKRSPSTKVRPKKIRTSRYNNRYSYQNGHYPKIKSTKYKTDDLKKGNLGLYETISNRIRSRKYVRRADNLDDITINVDSHSAKDNTEESIAENMDFDSNGENQKPFDVIYVNKKVVTIKETADGKKRRKISDVTEAKRIGRTKAKGYPSYLSELSIPATIKHRIGKRSVSNNGN